MSILLVQLTEPGILFGADRNITVRRTARQGPVSVTVSGQTQRPKVLKWPNHELIIGYVGEGTVGGKATDIWLYSFIGRNLTFADLDTLAEKLRAELDALWQAADFDQPLIIHVAGFELLAGEWTPRIYFIHNTAGLMPSGAYLLGAAFVSSEEISQPNYFGGKTGNQIQREVYRSYFSFRQGYDLAAFGTLEQHVRTAMTTLVYAHPSQPHSVPLDLEEWVKHVRFAVEVYGAYFKSFYPPFEQYVGGGADVVWAEWPAALPTAVGTP